MTSFRKYILNHVDDNSPAGDLARDFADDACAKGLSSYKSIRKHLEKHRACDAALDALDELYAKFTLEFPVTPTSRSASAGSR